MLPKHDPQRPSLHILLQHALNLHSDDRLGHTLHDDHRQAQAAPHSVRQSQKSEPTRRHTGDNRGFSATLLFAKRAAEIESNLNNHSKPKMRQEDEANYNHLHSDGRVLLLPIAGAFIPVLVVFERFDGDQLRERQ